MVPHKKSRRLKLLTSAGVAFTAAWFVGGLSLEHSRAADPARTFRSTFGVKKQPASQVAETRSDETRSVRMNFVATKWSDVLQRIAEDSGSTLVADEFPDQRFSRTDLHSYSRTEAIRILNEALAAYEFRILEKGQYLVLIRTRTTAPNYSRPLLRNGSPANGSDRAAPAEFQPSEEQPLRPIQQAGERRGATPKNQLRTAIADSAADDVDGDRSPFRVDSDQRRSPAAAGNRSRSIRQTAFQDEPAAGQNDAPADDQTTVTKVPPAPTVRKSYAPERRSAQSLSKILYDAFRDRAEIEDDGAGGLPTMRVFSARRSEKPDATVSFTMAVDMQNETLFVSGPEDQVDRVLRLLKTLDRAPQSINEATRLVATDKGAGAVARNLQPAINQLVAQNDDPTAAPPQDLNRKPNAADVAERIAGPIRGDVSVEAMEDMGVLILKGNQADVEAVMEIIRQIEELSAKTAPDVHLQLLESVDGQALASLLTTVYDQYNRARGRTDQQSKEISIFAVGRPNAVLILAPPTLLESVTALIEKLDTPVAPQTTFKVFRLKHAVATQVETTVAEFFQQTGGNNGIELGGLATRVRIISDVRTNSLIVLAQPNDMKEVEKIIAGLDKADSSTVSEVKVFELRNAVSSELAQTINGIIQATLNPPQTGQGQNQFGGFGQQGFGGTGGSTQLREVRSAILEYLGADGGAQMRLRSGILADIRVNADARTNTLIVTAPKESMALVAELVSRLDRPTSVVATIKHFSLKNADATSVGNVLNNLFGSQSNQGQQQGFGGGQNTSTQSVGIQLAGAEQAPSVVPLRFEVDVRSNSIVAIGTAEALDVVQALILRLDNSEIRQRKMEIVRLKNTPAADVATALNTFIQTQIQVLQGQSTQQGGSLVSAFELVDRDVIVQAENNTNSILISASPRYVEEMLEMVEALDSDLPQVVIQAMLVEVTLNSTDEFGVELGVQDSILFSRGLGTSLTPNAGTASTPGFNFNNTGALPNTNSRGMENLAGQGLSNLSVGRVNGDLGFGGLVLSAGSESVNILLRALAENRRTEVLSRPQIRTLHNKEGIISVSEQVPRPTTSSLANNGLSQQNFEYVNAGVTLDVIPKIGSDGKIQLQVIAQKNSRTGDVISGTASIPLISGTQVQAVLTVEDNQTAVLGGLITRQQIERNRRVPWLGDIPVIRHAFSYDYLSFERKELLIFLTPHVVKNAIDNENVKIIEAARLHWTESEAEAMHGPIYGIPADQAQQFNGGLPQDGGMIPNQPVLPPPAPAEESSPPPPMTQRRAESGIQQVSGTQEARAGRGLNRTSLFLSPKKNTAAKPSIEEQIRARQTAAQRNAADE